MRRAFTLLELLTVIIIIAVLAAMAIPNYFNAVERSRAAEAVNALGALRGSQVRYSYAHNGVYDGSADPLGGGLLANESALDVEIPGSAGKYFTFYLYSNTDQLASAVRNTSIENMVGGYTLSINAAGDIVCAETDLGACRKVGHGS